MSDVPKVGAEIKGLLAGASGRDVTLRRVTVTRWLALLKRQPAVHPPRAGSVPVTAQIIHEIFQLADRRRFNHQQIATQLRINMARASEVLTIRKLYREGFNAEEIAARLPRLSRSRIEQVVAVLAED